jgi:hypothetical protein
MSDLLVQIIFGWPFIILSLLVSVLGLILKRPWLLVVGAVLIAPFSYYLSGAPRINGLGIILPLFQLGAAYEIKTRKVAAAWILMLPAFLISTWLANAVISQY